MSDKEDAKLPAQRNWIREEDPSVGGGTTDSGKSSADGKLVVNVDDAGSTDSTIPFGSTCPCTEPQGCAY